MKHVVPMWRFIALSENHPANLFQSKPPQARDLERNQAPQRHEGSTMRVCFLYCRTSEIVPASSPATSEVASGSKPSKVSKGAKARLLQVFWLAEVQGHYHASKGSGTPVEIIISAP